MKRSWLFGTTVLLTAASLPAQQPSLDGPWTLWRRQPNGIPSALHVEVQSRRDSVTVTGINGLVLSGKSTSSGLALTGKAADKKTDVAVSARWVGDSLVGQGKQGPDTISLLWVALITILFIFPLYKAGLPWEDDFSWELTNYTVLWFAGIGIVFGGWWALSAKNWFKGPVRMGTEDELEAMEAKQEAGFAVPADTQYDTP